MCQFLGIWAITHTHSSGVGDQVDTGCGDIVLLLQNALDCCAAAATLHALHVQYELVHGRLCVWGGGETAAT